VVLSKRVVLAGLAILLAAGSARAQAWGGGATIGIVNDVEHHFHWDEFHSKDITGYLEYEIEKQIVVRATYGQMNVKGENAGQTFTLPSGEIRTMPDLTEDIRYATLGVSYEFFEGPFTSGMFAGIGGYKIVPTRSRRDRELPRQPRDRLRMARRSGRRVADDEAPLARRAPQHARDPLDPGPLHPLRRRRTDVPLLAPPFGWHLDCIRREIKAMNHNWLTPTNKILFTDRVVFRPVRLVFFLFL
jgi:hypothetical protein